MRELNLDGGERSILKALGFSSSAVTGEDLFNRCTGFEEAEFVDALKGLITMGYIDTDAGSGMRSLEDVKDATFQVNTGYSRDLKEALNPQPKKKSRRVRRE